MKTLYQKNLEQILNELEPEYIPPEYVGAASIMTTDGEKKVLTGPEFKSFVSKNGTDDIINVRILLDIEKTIRVIEETSDRIFKNY